MASSESAIPLELSTEAEQQRESSRAVQRASAHSAGGEHDSGTSRTSADDGSTGGGSNSSRGNDQDEDRYELSFVIHPPATVSVSAEVWPPAIVRIRRFRGDREIIPSVSTSSPVSERSHSSLRSSEEATNVSGSDHSNSTGVEEGVTLLCQLALYEADEIFAPIDPSPLQGVTVLSPQAYLDPQRLSEAHDNNNNNNNSNNQELSTSRRVYRYFGFFSNFRVTEPGQYSLSVVLLPGVGLAPLMHGQVAPAGRQLARITLPITVVEATGQPAEHPENGVLRLSDEDRRILQHFHEQGADVPNY
ncbi:hypothetical protein V1525DRAFT_404988 [Lipomyces kononenkoae]|uniref:Uncharacterized protein n=1 Tax=Lipomyces kononenkoae TaxID=34357 RepID=A0ACC3SZP7_LIPKO